MPSKALFTLRTSLMNFPLTLPATFGRNAVVTVRAASGCRASHGGHTQITPRGPRRKIGACTRSAPATCRAHGPHRHASTRASGAWGHPETPTDLTSIFSWGFGALQSTQHPLAASQHGPSGGAHPGPTILLHPGHARLRPGRCALHRSHNGLRGASLGTPSTKMLAAITYRTIVPRSAMSSGSATGGSASCAPPGSGSPSAGSPASEHADERGSAPTSSATSRKTSQS